MHFYHKKDYHAQIVVIGGNFIILDIEGHSNIQIIILKLFTMKEVLVTTSGSITSIPTLTLVNGELEDKVTEILIIGNISSSTTIVL